MRGVRTCVLEKKKNQLNTIACRELPLFDTAAML